MTKNKFQKLIFSLCLLVVGTAAHYAAATTAVDQQQTSVSEGTYGQAIGQSFTPAQVNLTSIDLQCIVDGSLSSDNIDLYICKGNFTDQATGWDTCTAADTQFVYKRNANITCGGGWTTNNIAIDNFQLGLDAGSPYYFVIRKTGTYTSGKPYNLNWALKYNSAYSGGQWINGQGIYQPSYDLYFKTYYDTSWSGLINLNVTSPTNGTTTSSNVVQFTGNVWGADSLEIYYGPPDSSPATMLFGMNIANYQYFKWDDLKEIPNGRWWVWYIAKRGTSTTFTSTTTLIVSSLNTNTTISAASSSMSTTSAANILMNTQTSCGAGVSNYIDSPDNFWASNTPAFLQNGSTTATTTPGLYNLLTTPIYNLMRTPVNMANSFACYFSGDNALVKGQATAITILSYLGIISGLNSLFFGGFPIMTILLVWAVGMSLRFMSKLPFVK